MPRMYDLGIANVLGRGAEREAARMRAGLPTSEAVLTLEAKAFSDVANFAVQSVVPLPAFDPETDYNIGSTVDPTTESCRIGVAPGVVLQCSLDGWVAIHAQIA